MERTGHIQAHRLATLLLISGTVILAVDPAAWLLRSWTDPGSGSHGWAVFAVSLVLFAWSWSSPLADPAPIPRSPLVLLLGTAAIRAVGQVLDIDTVSALALGVDVYALARLARLDRRARAVSPVGLAALFMCSLPLPRIIERSIGQGLQELSADGACAILGLFFDDVTCNGVNLVLSGRSIMVDLPCAGISGLVLLATVLLFAATLTRPSLGRLFTTGLLALATALFGNILRVTLLSVGATYGPDLVGLDPLLEPWHSLIGLLTLAVSALPPIGILMRGRPMVTHVSKRSGRLPLPSAIGFATLCLVILVLPQQPLDASSLATPVTLPQHINGHVATVHALSAMERRYFQTYGGGAAKAAYGPMGLLVSRTSSPIRHLHDAQDCLRGLGYDVEFLGTAIAPAPASIFQLTGPDGGQWTAHVSFVANDGTIVPTVSAAVWHWLSNRDTIWTSLQRITPAALPEETRHTMDLAVLASMDIPARTPVAATPPSNQPQIRNEQ